MPLDNAKLMEFLELVDRKLAEPIEITAVGMVTGSTCTQMGLSSASNCRTIM